MGTRTSTLVEGGHFFEGPRWHDGTWWVSDFYAHTVSTVTADGEQTTVMEVAAQPSGLGWMPDGSMLVVSMRDHRILRRRADGTVALHADLSAHCGGKANDMVVDAVGRAYVGNFGFDLMGGADPATTALVRVDPDGSVHVAAEDLWFPNGSVITPDGSTLIVGETMGARYTAFSIGDDGSLSDRRVWAQIAPAPTLGTLQETLGGLGVGPDGCSLDADGRIWAADAIGGRVIRVAEGGAIEEEIRMPEGLGAFACALGGEDGRTLLICAAPDFAEHERAAKAEALLLTAQVDVPHAGLP